MASSPSTMFKVYFTKKGFKELRCFQLKDEQINYLQLKIAILSLFNLNTVDDFDLYWNGNYILFRFRSAIIILLLLFKSLSKLIMLLRISLNIKQNTVFNNR